jgi:hypothetical protein
MCYVISAENILMNFFLNRKENALKVSELSDLKCKVEQNVGSNVYADLTRDSIFEAITANPGILEWDCDNGIISFNVEGKADESKDLFRNRIPESFRTNYFQVLKGYNFRGKYDGQHDTGSNS